MRFVVVCDVFSVRFHLLFSNLGITPSQQHPLKRGQAECCEQLSDGEWAGEFYWFLQVSLTPVTRGNATTSENAQSWFAYLPKQGDFLKEDDRMCTVQPEALALFLCAILHCLDASDSFFFRKRYGLESSCGFHLKACHGIFGTFLRGSDHFLQICLGVQKRKTGFFSLQWKRPPRGSFASQQCGCGGLFASHGALQIATR